MKKLAVILLAGLVAAAFSCKEKKVEPKKEAGLVQEAVVLADFKTHVGGDEALEKKIVKNVESKKEAGKAFVLVKITEGEKRTLYRMIYAKDGEAWKVESIKTKSYEKKPGDKKDRKDRKDRKKKDKSDWKVIELKKAEVKPAEKK